MIKKRPSEIQINFKVPANSKKINTNSGLFFQQSSQTQKGLGFVVTITFESTAFGYILRRTNYSGDFC